MAAAKFLAARLLSMIDSTTVTAKAMVRNRMTERSLTFRSDNSLATAGCSSVCLARQELETLDSSHGPIPCPLDVFDGVYVSHVKVSSPVAAIARLMRPPLRMGGRVRPCGRRRAARTAIATEAPASAKCRASYGTGHALCLSDPAHHRQPSFSDAVAPPGAPLTLTGGTAVRGVPMVCSGFWEL